MNASDLVLGSGERFHRSQGALALRLSPVSQLAGVGKPGSVRLLAQVRPM